MFRLYDDSYLQPHIAYSKQLVLKPDMATCGGLSDTIDDDEQLFFSTNPYLYEPEYTDEELSEMDAQRAERERATQEAAAAVENRDRISGDWWCQCGSCSPMQTEEECYCCKEWDLVIPQMQELELDTSFQNLDVSGQSASRVVCITEHQDFSPLLSRGVLETFFSVEKINWKKKPKPAGPNGQLSMLSVSNVTHRSSHSLGLVLFFDVTV